MITIKLLTLNTHSLIEDDYQLKLKEFVKSISEIKPDIIALQEANQSIAEEEISSSELLGYFPCGKNIKIRNDNHVLNVVNSLREFGINYYWSWLPVKCGYKIFEEGVAVMSLSEITNTHVFTISREDNYYNWKTRKILGITAKNTDDTWFYSVHTGWWDDIDDPFFNQWQRITEELSSKNNIWLMGDFNAPAEIKGEGYDLMRTSSFKDSYTNAEIKDIGHTIPGGIDGWNNTCSPMRIDQLWFGGNFRIKSSKVIFNGKNLPVVSDHFGVLVICEKGKSAIKKSSGILLHISSLPSKYGIGCFSKNAYDFVDFLKKAGQSFWQILPLNPTSYGDSPYQSFSTFAGNPYFINQEDMRHECESLDWGENPEKIDFEKVYINRRKILKALYKKREKNTPEFKKFCHENSFWLEDFSLFMALKEHFGGKAWNEWDDDIRFREKTALEHWKNELAEEIDYQKFIQYQFFTQWKRLKSYANLNSIKIIGDIPIYVAFDSADVWANPELFKLGNNLLPTSVAGCPPDGFSADGQLWGNPLYEWDYHKVTGFSWWISRLKQAFLMYDTVRIDHFRGFDEYYSIPYGAENAVNGKWEKGPGIELFNALKEKLGNKDIIAEDLGFITDSVKNLLAESGFPGMKILQFAFDERDTGTSSDYLPHNYPENSVAYTGTHDNQTLNSWFNTISEKEQNMARRYLADFYTPKDELGMSFISLIMRSPAKLCIVPMQDWLGLDDNSRMNTPSTIGTNWQWRIKKEALSCELAKDIKEITEIYGR